MKKLYKILAFALTILMLSACVIGCQPKTKQKVNVTVSVVVEGETILGPYMVELESDVDNPPTILQAVREACILNDITEEADDMAISTIGEYSAKVEGEYTYFWEFTVNGVIPAGRAGAVAVNANDEIVYTYIQAKTSDLAAAGAK